MAYIFEFLSKDGNITPEKARKSRQMQFHVKTAYVWGPRYQWDPSLLMNPARRFAHFMPPWNISILSYTNREIKSDTFLLVSVLFPYKRQKEQKLPNSTSNINGI